MTKRISKSKFKMFLVIFFLFPIIAIIATSCVCPLFSLFERFTGFKIKAGKYIDQSKLADELIYPGSVALVQAEGDIDRIMELIGQYGAAIPEEELSILEELPREIKDQEVTATVYSTADDKIRVLDYYNSLDDKGWDIQEFTNDEQVENTEQPAMLLASKNDIKQAFMLAGSSNNTFIIFVDFNWEELLNLNN